MADVPVDERSERLEKANADAIIATLNEQARYVRADPYDAPPLSEHFLVNVVKVIRRLVEIEEAAREFVAARADPGDDLKETADRVWETYDRLRTALEADTGGDDGDASES